MVVRATTFSNAALELALGAALSLALWRALSERSEGWLVAAGALTGAALLTKLTMAAFAPALAVAASPSCARAAGARSWPRPALPAAAVAPWIAFNLAPLRRAHRQRAGAGVDEPTLNPDRIDYGVGDLAAKHVALLNGVLPDEWWVEFLSSAKRRLRDVFMGLVLLLPLLAAVRIPAADRRRALAVLLLPLVTGVVLMSVSLLAENWDAFYARYLYGALPGFARVRGAGRRKGAGERGLFLGSAGADRPPPGALGSPVDGHARRRSSVRSRITKSP